MGYNAGGGLLLLLTFHRPGREFAAAPLEAADAARALWPNVFFPEGAGAELRELAFERVADLAQRATAFAVAVPREAKITREGFRKILEDKLLIKEGYDEA